MQLAMLRTHLPIPLGLSVSLCSVSRLAGQASRQSSLQGSGQFGIIGRVLCSYGQDLFLGTGRHYFNKD
jgi:hypothetical protein